MERSIGIEISRDNQVNLRDRPHFFMCPSLRTYFSQKTNYFSKKYIYIYLWNTYCTSQEIMRTSDRGLGKFELSRSSTIRYSDFEPERLEIGHFNSGNKK